MSIARVSKAAGIDTVKCPHCKASFSTDPVIRAFFHGMISVLRLGKSITIQGFGTFKAIKRKGREHATPIIPSGKMTFPDMWHIKFNQTKSARDKLNED